MKQYGFRYTWSTKTEKSIFERSYNDYKTALSRLTSIQKQEYERRISGTTADSTDSDTSVEKVHSNSMSRIIWPQNGFLSHFLQVFCQA